MRPNQKNSVFRIIIPILIGLLIGVSYLAYPKLKGYFERMEIEKQNQEVLEKIKEEGAAEKTKEQIEVREEVDGDESEDGDEDVTVAEEEIEPEEIIILENAYLEVPFVCQAPFQTEANWVYHEESCEEAALLQVHYYYEEVETVDKQTAHETLLDMIEWQEDNLGSHHDIYADEMKTFIQGYYDYPKEDIKIIYDADLTDIKKVVSQGYPVIVPIMGDLLQNPYYPYPGYHMLTVIGYTDTHIITNDVGTRQGKDFTYPNERFKKAMDGAGGDIVYIIK